MAMRQVGFEAAKKAGDAKTKAREDELERLKARSTDLQKLDKAEPTGMSPSSGVTETTEAEKPETGTNDVAGAADDIPPTEEGRKEERAENADVETKEGVTAEMASAAEKEMAISANEATKEAAEPGVLEREGQAEPDHPAAQPTSESEPAAKEPETASKTEPQHIPNAKEAEEEANKAIIADEATHVHIAGSPPPYASPGMKVPKDEDQHEPIPEGMALKDGNEKESSSSSSSNAVEPQEQPSMEEDDAGKPDATNATFAAEDGSNAESALPVDQSEKVEETTEAKKSQDEIHDEPATEESKATQESPKAPHTENEATRLEETTTPNTTTSENEDDNASQRMEPPKIESKPTEVENTVSETIPVTAATQPHSMPEGDEMKTQQQPAASGEQAGESVGD